MHALSVANVVIMVIVGVVIQLFLNLFFSGAVKTGSFSGLDQGGSGPEMDSFISRGILQYI